MKAGYKILRLITSLPTSVPLFTRVTAFPLYPISTEKYYSLVHAYLNNKSYNHKNKKLLKDLIER